MKAILPVKNVRTTQPPRTTQLPSVATAAPISFEAFYERHFEHQVRRAALMLGSIELAHDLVQDVFMRLLERWDRVRNPEHYLSRSVLNACRDNYRRKRTATRALTLLRAEQACELQEPLDDALATLPFNQRAAIVLKFYEGLTVSQIADRMRCPTGSIGPWISRGLRSLEKELQ